jgi:RNase P/RNase MRP subunit p29|tara:strand:- start:99 stop:293 length:195 start_codon:yes stop_codon:yes gene_type:complete
MDEEGKDNLVSYLKDAEVKVVWREEERTKVGRGKIVKDDENFVVLTGEKGTVIVSKKDIIAIKQ